MHRYFNNYMINMHLDCRL